MKAALTVAKRELQDNLEGLLELAQQYEPQFQKLHRTGTNITVDNLYQKACSDVISRKHEPTRKYVDDANRFFVNYIKNYNLTEAELQQLRDFETAQTGGGKKRKISKRRKTTKRSKRTKRRKKTKRSKRRKRSKR